MKSRKLNFRLVRYSATFVFLLAVLILAGCATPTEMALRGDLGELTLRLDREESVATQTFEDEMTLLHYAAIGGHVPIARLLLDRGAVVNVKNLYDLTPLYFAVDMRNREMVEFLLVNGADLSIGVATTSGFTPLMISVSASVKDKPVMTPSATGNLMWVQTRQLLPPSKAIAQILLNAGADPNKQTPNGNTSLHLAAFWGAPEVVKLLLENGADPSILNEGGQTAQELALAHGNDYVAQVIREFRSN